MAILKMRVMVKKNRLFLLLVLFAVAVQIIQLDGEWERMDGDDAQFILEANSLITNHSYNDPNWIYTPEANYCTKSDPPGWPLLLIPVILFFGKNLLVLKLYVILYVLGAGILLFKIIKIQSNDYWLSFLITAIYFSSMTTIVFSRVVYTEWSYMVISFLIIILFIVEKDRCEDNKKIFFIGLCLGFSLLLRSVAISLVGAAIAVIIQYTIVHQRKHWARMKWIGIILFSTILIYQTAYFLVQPEKGIGYQEQFLSKNLYYQEEGQADFGDIIGRMLENGRHFIMKMEPLLLGRSWHETIEYRYPHLKKFLNLSLYVVGSLFFIIIVIGFISRVSRKPSFIEYYVFFYLAIMSIIWFHYEVYRYLMPITPFLVFYFSMGLLLILKRVFNKLRTARSVLYGLITFVLFVNICQAGVEIYRYKFTDMNPKKMFAPYKTTVKWLKEHVQSDEIIIADDPRWYALETELPVTMFPVSRDVNKVYHYISQFPESVIVFDPRRPLTKSCLQPVLEKYAGRFQFLKTIGHLTLYRYSES